MRPLMLCVLLVLAAVALLGQAAEEDYSHLPPINLKLTQTEQKQLFSALEAWMSKQPRPPHPLVARAFVMRWYMRLKKKHMARTKQLLTDLLRPGSSRSLSVI